MKEKMEAKEFEIKFLVTVICFKCTVVTFVPSLPWLLTVKIAVEEVGFHASRAGSREFLDFCLSQTV